MKCNYVITFTINVHNNFKWLKPKCKNVPQLSL